MRDELRRVTFCPEEDSNALLRKHKQLTRGAGREGGLALTQCRGRGLRSVFLPLRGFSVR